MAEEEEEKYAPSCRYGHGPMELLGGAFQMTGADASHVPGEFPGDMKLVVKPNGKWLTVCSYWCESCGYVELRDTRAVIDG